MSRPTSDVLYDAPEKPWWHEPGIPLADVLYDPSTAYKNQFAELLPRLGDQVGLTVAQQEEERRALSLGMRELSGGADQSGLQRILDIVVEDRLKPPTEEEIRVRDIQARRALRERYGAADGERVVERTKKLLAINPKLKRLVQDAPTAVSHPAVVLALAERARRDPATR